MIQVTVEYDPMRYDPTAIEFSWLIESIIGKVFAENMDLVDVRLRKFSEGDESTFPMLITIDGDAHEIGTKQDGLAALADVVHEAIEAGCQMYPTGTTPLPDFRVWVRAQPGAISDPVRVKGKT